MKQYFIALGVIALAFSGCAFEPPCGSFEQCAEEQGIDPNNSNNANNANNSNNTNPNNVNNVNNVTNNSNNSNNVNNVNNVNSANNKECPGPSSCGAAQANQPFELVDDGYGCRRFDDELFGTTQAFGDAVCDGPDQLVVNYSNCENTSYILEAVLIPEPGCDDELVLDVRDPVYNCGGSMLTRCEDLPDGNQRIQLLIRAGDYREFDVMFEVSSANGQRGGYRLQTRVFR